MAERTTTDEPYRLVPLFFVDGAVAGYAKVSHEDYRGLSEYRWRLNTGYAQRSGLPMHRVILGLRPRDGAMVDHINGDTLDNRRSNLRMCPNGSRENGQNRRLSGNNRSGYRGVSWDDRSRKWRARVMVGGRTYAVGVFVDVHEAGAAAAAFRAEHMPYSADARA